MRNVKAVGLLIGVSLSATSSSAAPFAWDVAIDGGNWSDLRWNGGVTGPTTPGNTATIKNDVPGAWTAGLQNITVNVAVDIDSLTIEDNVGNSAIGLLVNQDLTVGTLSSKQDGAARNQITVAASKKITVNTLSFTGDYHISVSGTGTIKFAPVANAATFNYAGFNDNNRLDVNMDFSDANLATMTFNRSSGATVLESLNATWKVGNPVGTQTWVASGGGGGAMLTLQSRSNGTFVNYDKADATDIDMGKRTTGVLSEGFRIVRGNLDNPVNGVSRLFATSTNTAAGGTAKIADYYWQMTFNNPSNATTSHRDVIGSNLRITNGDLREIQGDVALEKVKSYVPLSQSG